MDDITTTKHAECDELIGVIHEQANSINSMLDVQTSLLQYLSPDPFDKNTVSFESAKDIILLTVSDFNIAFKNLIKNTGESKVQSRGISDEKWVDVIDLYNKLQLYDNEHSSLSVNFFRKIASDALSLVETCNLEGEKARFNKTILSGFKRSSKEVQRIICLFEMKRILKRSYSINEQLIGILTSDNSYDGLDSSVCNLLDIVNEVKEKCNPIADTKKIKIRIKTTKRKIFVRTNRSHLIQAVSNLVDNAIKYTGVLHESSRYENAWIDINLDAEGDNVKLSIESWGTPITEEEINEGLLFSRGYRGRYARVAGIEGTGYGLSDVNLFAIKNGGTVIIDTLPVNKHSAYSKNIKTTVSLILPENI